MLITILTILNTGDIHTTGGIMIWLKVSWIILAVSLGCVGNLYAQEASAPTTRLSLQRNSTYEQYLHFQASPDTAITPARVLRWMNALMGHSNLASPSNFEFQPVLRVNDTQKQIIAQFAYKF